MTQVATARHLAHAPEWADVIASAYGHTPLYLTANDSAGRTGLLPAFIVRRPLAGTIVSSMPFLDGGGPCCDSAGIARTLVARLFDEAHRAGARYVDIRSAGPLETGAPALVHKVNMRLDLTPDADRMWTGFDRSVRNQVRKAQRAGLTVEEGGQGQLDEFYPIYLARMRDLGSPAHSRLFFGAIFRLFGTRARLFLVRNGARPIGGLVWLQHGDTATVPWASCLRDSFALCPNMLLYWEAIREASRAGIARFDFGRSTRGSGTYGFKAQWGCVEEPLFWYTVALDGTALPAHRASGASRLASVWRRLPHALTARLGPRLRRYLVQ